MKQDQETSHIRWDSGGRFNISISSNRGIIDFNDQGMIPIALDGSTSSPFGIKSFGSLGSNFSIYHLQSFGNYIRKPKYDKDLISFGFIEKGNLTIQRLSGKISGTKDIAIILNFKDYVASEVSNNYSSLTGAFETCDLIRVNAALTGSDNKSLPLFLPCVDMATPGVRALSCTLRSVYQQSKITALNTDLTFLLIQEIIGYQLLSVWPRETNLVAETLRDIRANRLSRATDYIRSNLSSDLMLADVAAAAGLSVRALQDNFRRLVGKTPFQYIIDLRLMRVHEDLLAKDNRHISIGDIAKRWGFVHVSDFGRRYRLMYGCTPSKTRQAAH